MQLVRKRRLEQAVFDIVREAFPHETEGRIDPGESPDFVISGPESRLGVEVTSLHGADDEHGSREANEHVSTALFLHLVSRAVKRTDARCGVGIQLMRSIAGGKRRAQQAAQEVLALLEPALQRPGVSAHWSQGDRTPGFPPELQSLEVHWAVGAKSPMMFMGGPGFLCSGNFGDPLRKIVAAKSAKVDRYLERCDRCWLAVLLPHYFEAEDRGILSPALVEVHQTSFERVIVVDLERKKAWPAGTRRG